MDPIDQLEKEPELIRVLKRLRREVEGLTIADHWDGDLCATGVANRSDTDHLVYISTFGMEPDRFFCRCDIAGPDGDPGPTIAQGDSADYAELLAAVEKHLRGDPELARDSHGSHETREFGSPPRRCWC